MAEKCPQHCSLACVGNGFTFGAIFIGYYLFAHNITEADKVTGMLIGVYTGGTPNLAAIGTALHVSPDIFILTHTYDLIIGSVALLFLMTVAQRLFNTFLPKYGLIRKGENIMQVEMEEDENSHIENYDGLYRRENLPEVFKSLLASIIIFAIGGGLSLFVSKNNQVVVVILTITTLGLLASLLKPFNKLKLSFPLECIYYRFALRFLPWQTCGVCSRLNF